MPRHQQIDTSAFYLTIQLSFIFQCSTLRNRFCGLWTFLGITQIGHLFRRGFNDLPSIISYLVAACSLKTNHHDTMIFQLVSESLLSKHKDIYVENNSFEQDITEADETVPVKRKLERGRGLGGRGGEDLEPL